MPAFPDKYNGTFDLEEFRRDVGKYKGQGGDFSNLFYTADVGIFSDELKKKLVSSHPRAR